MSKALVGRALSNRVKNGDILGLGSGSTAEEAVRQIGERIKKEKLQVSGIATSHEIAVIAQRAGVQVLSSLSETEISWAFDGADEIDPDFRMIKGRGAAMLNEKIIAERANGKLIIIATEEKLVDKLGTNFAIPIEVIPEAFMIVEAGLKKLGATQIEHRKSAAKYGPTFSEHNNLVLDVRFNGISHELPAQIKALTGVVEHGLFVGLTNELFIAKSDGVYSRTRSNGAVSDRLIEPA